MTALGDALVAAQRQAIAALEKAFVGGQVNETELYEALDNIGASDAVDKGYLLAALHVLQQWGSPPPTNGQSYSERRKTEPLTGPQGSLIERLCQERDVMPPDFAGITKETASEIITSLQNGNYDPAKWNIPF